MARVPGGHQPVRRRIAAGGDGVELGPVQRALVHAGPIDLAAIGLRHEGSACLVEVARTGHEERRLRQVALAEAERLGHMRTVVDRADAAEQTVVAIRHAVLVDGRAHGVHVERGGDEVPHLRVQGHLGRDVVDFVAAADPELEMAFLTDPQAVAHVARVVPAADQALAQTDARQTRVDEGEQRDAAVEGEPPVRIGHLQVRTDLRVLLAHGPGAIALALDFLLEQTRSVRMLVAVDQPDELRLRAVDRVGADVEIDGIARSDGDFVGVAEELDLGQLGVVLSSCRGGRGGRGRSLRPPGDPGPGA